MKYITFFKTLIFSIFFTGMCGTSTAQIFNPEIENYSIEDYSADNQNWDIDVAANGVVYVANNSGLLRYNGQSWQLFELPKKTTIRAIFCSNNKVYTGSYEEFGYWEKNDKGDYIYTSLVSFFDENHEFKNEEFWQILRFKNNIVFRSFRGLYVFDGKKVSYIENSPGITQITVYQGKLLTSSLINGVNELKNNKLIPFSFPNNEIFKSISSFTVDDNLLFLFDSNKGAFLYDSNKIKPLSKKLNSFLKDFVVNKTAFIDKNRIAIGTIKNGIIIFNIENENIQYFNNKLGLQNNTILGLKFHNGILWGALDNGIAKINFESTFSYYRDFSGVLGTVYDVEFFDNKYYLASNTGLYSFNDNNLQLIKGSEGHIWDLSIINNQLICGHNKGTYLVKNNELLPIYLSSGGVFGYVKIPKKEDWYLQETYVGISLLTNFKNIWEVKSIKNIDFPVNNIVFENDSIIWATHPYKGVYRIKLSEDFSEANKISYYNDFEQYKTEVFKIESKIFFYNSNNWYDYNIIDDKIKLVEKLQHLKNKILIGKDKQGSFYIDRNKLRELLYLDNDFNEIFQIIIPENKQHLVAKYEKVIVKNDSIRILNLNDGFATFNIRKGKNQEKEKKHFPKIEKIYSKETFFSIKDSILEIPFKDAQYLSFEVYSPNKYNVSHSYIITGKLERQELIKNGNFVLQNLRFGTYILQIQDNDSFTKSKITFNVSPPWYLSKLMKVVYLLLFIFFIYIIFKFNKIKIRKEQIKLQRKYIRETQEKIVALEKDTLKKELRNKKQELLSTTSSIIKKNEVIMILTNELKRLKNLSPNIFRTEQVLESSKKDINSKSDWKVFESNFNELNQNFFKKLIEFQPKLTTKDLKLCAYVKTGLTSKKIAPLMGISTRGVELHRYRIRKKLSIPSNHNLSYFLRNF